jgi:hypothetical protein
VLESEWRDPGDVGLADVPAVTGELIERCLDVGRVPECNGVEGQAEGAELLLLLLACGTPDFCVGPSVDRIPVTYIVQKPYAEWYVYAISFARHQRPGNEAWLRSRLD